MAPLVAASVTVPAVEAEPEPVEGEEGAVEGEEGEAGEAGEAEAPAAE